MRPSPRCQAILASALAVVSVPAQAPPSVPPQTLLSPESLWGLLRVGELALAPDGRHLAYVVRRTDLAQNRSAATVWLLDLGTAGAEPRELGPGSAPAWLPTGDQVAVVTPDGLTVWPVGDGPKVSIPVAGGAANVRWSPRGTHFSYTQDVAVEPGLAARHPDLPLAKARAYDALMVRHWDHWRDGSYSHLFVQPFTGGGGPRDLLAGEAVDTPLPPFGGVEQMAWSPDGQELCYTAARVPNRAVSTDSSLWAVPVGGGTARNLTPELPGYDQDPVYSPDGQWIAFVSMARAGFEADRLRLMLHERRSGVNRELLPDFDASVHELRWTADSQSLFFTVETEGTTQLYRTPLTKPRAHAVTQGRHALSGLQVAPDGATVYALRTSMERPAEVVRIDVATGAIAPLTDHNGRAFAELALPSVEAEWFPASDGQRIHAFVVKPPGFDPARRYPMILFCQGGPQSMVGQGFSLRWNFHLMAARGYVVAAVNRRGLPGFGQAWNDQISRDWGGQAMRDLLAVTDAMQARPYIDRQHCAAVGASFGGYSVYWLMGNAGDRFAAMIAHCGVFNLESMYLATEELWFVDWDLGGPFWKSPEVGELYRRFSPHRYVANWRTPLLVIHGERDYRVPYDQGLQAFTAAQLQGVPSRLLTFPDEGHWVLQPQNGVLWQREYFAWLDRFCRPAADPSSRGSDK
ncbi:MAG: S9 family peptidase [Planctomycetes bacterium]|nr:S9 family peptidase [Planctomycetota bacterium]